MNIDTYVAIVDTSILALLIIWSAMDRSNLYFLDVRKMFSAMGGAGFMPFCLVLCVVMFALGAFATHVALDLMTVAP